MGSGQFTLQKQDLALGCICQARSEVNKDRDIKEDTI